MSYNDGNEHIAFYNENVDRKQIAEQFSEGDFLLRDVLLELWESGIKTTACCKGHDDNNIAYISLIMDKNSQNLIQSICNYIYFQGDNLELSFTSANNKDYDTFIIYMANEETKYRFINFISNFLITENQIVDIKNRIPLYANYLLSFARKAGLDCRYLVNADEMMVGFNKPGTLSIFGENSPLLDNILDQIKDTGNLPLIPMKCSEQSIESFLSVIYPNVFEQYNSTSKK